MNAEADGIDAGSPETKIFISYSRKNIEFVDRLEAALTMRGLMPTIDRSEIYAFEDWWKRIEDLIVESDTIIFVLSPDAVTSDVCRKEVDFAASLKKRFAPIIYERVNDDLVPAHLRRLNYIFFDNQETFEANVDKLVEALGTDIEWIRRHTQLGEQARRWDIAGRPGPGGLMLRPPLLEQAEAWLSFRPNSAPEPTESIRAFIQSSRASFDQEQAARQEQINRRLISESNRLAELADSHIRIGDASAGAAFALEALSDESDSTARPYVPKAAGMLLTAHQHLHEITIFTEHGAALCGAAFSPEGRHVLTAAQDKTARLWDAETGQQVAVFRHHKAHDEDARDMLNAEFSADGQRVLTASKYYVRLWSVETGNEIALLDAGFGLDSATFSPDGTRVATCGHKGTHIWDGRNGKQIMELPHESGFCSARFSPDGQHIVVSTHLDVRLYELKAGKELISVKYPEDELSIYLASASFIPDLRLLITAGSAVRLWDAQSGKELLILEPYHHGEDVHVVSPDGKLVVTSSADFSARLWDITIPQQLSVLRGHEDVITHIAFSPDGHRIATVSRDRSVRLWNLEGKETAVLRGHDFADHNARLRGVAFSPDGLRLVTASDDNTARLWSVEAPHAPSVLSGHEDVVREIAFTPDGRRMATACNDHTARIWDMDTRKEIAVLSGHALELISVAFSPDGRRIATASSDDTVRLWDTKTYRQTDVISRQCTKAAFSPDGRQLLIACSGNNAAAWLYNVDPLEVRGSFKGHGSSVTSAVFSPDGRRVLTASQDYTARIWDVKTYKEVAVLQGHEDYLTSAVFSPDGRRIVTSSQDKTARLWDTETLEEIGVLKGHSGELYGAAFSPDGRCVVTGSTDATARVWSVETCQEIGVLPGDLEVPAVAFSPNGRCIATASCDNTVRLWHFFSNTHELIDIVKKAIPRSLTLSQREMAFLDPEPPSWCVEMAKWPYHTSDWKEWLQHKRASRNPPLANSVGWWRWVATLREKQGDRTGAIDAHRLDLDRRERLCKSQISSAKSIVEVLWSHWHLAELDDDAVERYCFIAELNSRIRYRKLVSATAALPEAEARLKAREYSRSVYPSEKCKAWGDRMGWKIY